MGVHTGEALLVDRHYVGMDVHRAARIGACGHGGQVVLSPSTVGVLEPGEFVLRDLGAHRLKDLTAPVVLHQLGEETFPPLKALFRTNLPVPATPFLGRAEELCELLALATEPGVRVLTLTGPGGTGKTRLALQLAAELSDQYPDGTWWVPLAPLRDAGLVGSAIAHALDVDEESGREITDSISNALTRKRSLLLVDNCEHVIDSVASLVGRLVGSCPDVFVIATSREPLFIPGENVFAVQPLVAGDAVDLFFARARAAGARLDHNAGSAVVIELCARLDNLPLAVELAAARTPALPPSALLERLATRLDVLAGPRGGEERQRTLRAAIAWSYDLLEERERRLFRRFAAFVGGASLPAIETVCEADLQDALSVVSKSLVRQAPVDGEPRYFMLETIREFAAEELARSGELDGIRDRHVRWFSDLARTTGTELDRADSRERLSRLELDLANLRAALAWTEERPATAQDGVALAIALGNRHFVRGRYSEAEGVIRRALALEPESLDAAVLYGVLGSSLRLQGRPREALDSFREAERALDTLQDRNDEWWKRWLDVEIRLATLYYFRNAQDALAELAGTLEPLVGEHGTPQQRLDFLHLRNQQAYREERYTLSQETEELVRETYRMAVELGEPGADFTLGFCLLWRGKPEEAEEYLARGREVARADGFALIETRCLVYGVIARRLTERRRRCPRLGSRAACTRRAPWVCGADDGVPGVGGVSGRGSRAGGENVARRPSRTGHQKVVSARVCSSGPRCSRWSVLPSSAGGSTKRPSTRRRSWIRPSNRFRSSSSQLFELPSRKVARSSFRRCWSSPVRSDTPSQARESTPLGGAVKRLRVTPAIGESTRVRSLIAGSDAAVARVRSLRGEEAVPPWRNLPGTESAGAWRLPCSLRSTGIRSRGSRYAQMPDGRHCRGGGSTNASHQERHS